MPFEYELIQWLSSQPELKDIPVSSQPPAERPHRFITVERTGGSQDALTDRPNLAVQCWARSEVEAAWMAELVANIVFPRVYELPDVAKFTVGSVYSYPLDETQPRYQLTVSAVIQKAFRQPMPSMD